MSPRRSGFILLLLLLLQLVAVSDANVSLRNHHEHVARSLLPSTATNADENSSETLLQHQLTALRVCGSLTLLMYVPLSLVVMWRMSLHCLYSSRSSKKVFHAMLLMSTLLQLPEAIGWIWFPFSQSWEILYICRIYSLLLLAFCKSYMAICWAGVVSAGQQTAQRRISKLVILLNLLLILWGVVIPILLSRYSDDVRGQSSFMKSTLRGVLTYSGVVIILAYGLLLGYQGFRLRRRLLDARGTVPAASVQKSLTQLMLAISIFIIAAMVRLLALVLNELSIAMSMIVYLVLYNIIPNVFPTICMLYLMRKITDKNSSGVEGKEFDKKRMLTKYMSDPDSDTSGRGSRGSSGSDKATHAYGGKKAQWELRIQQEYLRHQRDQIQIDNETQQSPAFCWTRESTERR